MGHHLGNKEPEKITNLLGSAVSIFLAISAFLTVVLIIFARPIASIMQAPEEALDLTALYIRICGIGYTFVVFYNFISSIFRGLGNSKLPLIFVCIACVVNIVGDLVLVAGLKMNVAGAAIATIGAQAVSVILSLVIIRRTKVPFSFSVRDIRFHADTHRILKVGVPLAMQELLTSLGMLAMCAFVNRIGLDASSGYGVAQKIQTFVLLVPMSIMQCMAPFVSQNVGAKREDRAKRAMLCGIAIGAVVGLTVAVLVFFFGDYLAKLFTTDGAVITRAFEYLRGFAPEAFVTCILFSFLGYFNGHAKTVFVMWESLARTFLARLPIAYIMSIQPGISLTWVALAGPISTTCGIVVCLVYYAHLRREIKRLPDAVL
jgi:putative MATE family efflux protein